MLNVRDSRVVSVSTSSFVFHVVGRLVSSAISFPFMRANLVNRDPASIPRVYAADI